MDLVEISSDPILKNVLCGVVFFGYFCADSRVPSNFDSGFLYLYITIGLRHCLSPRLPTQCKELLAARVWILDSVNKIVALSPVLSYVGWTCLGKEKAECLREAEVQYANSVLDSVLRSRDSGLETIYITSHQNKLNVVLLLLYSYV